VTAVLARVVAFPVASGGRGRVSTAPAAILTFRPSRERLAALDAGVLSPRYFPLSISRRSAGFVRRPCWQPAWELGRPDALWLEPCAKWSAAIAREVVASAARRLPATSGSGPYVVSLQAPGFSSAQGVYYVLHVTRGRWRVEVSLGYDREVASAALDAFRELRARHPELEDHNSD
jgi:hypothetical protein